MKPDVHLLQENQCTRIRLRVELLTSRAPSTQVNERLGGIERRLDAVDARFNAIDQRFNWVIGVIVGTRLTTIGMEITTIQAVLR